MLAVLEQKKNKLFYPNPFKEGFKHPMIVCVSQDVNFASETV